jgi:hypothetical protein
VEVKIMKKEKITTVLIFKRFPAQLTELLDLLLCDNFVQGHPVT